MAKCNLANDGRGEHLWYFAQTKNVTIFNKRYAVINVDYPNILTLIKDYLDPKRTESASFLIWYLENYYRLDSQEAIDAVCDQSNDKGIDGIYINESNGTIDVFQSKISQKPGRTIGDKTLREFAGTLSQFDTKESLQNLVNTGGDTQVVQLIRRLQLPQILDQYKIRGIFLCNSELDANGAAFLNESPHIEFVGKINLETTFISSSRAVPKGQIADFDVTGIDISQHYVDPDTLAIIVPIKARELVRMPGIQDQSVYAYNVRGPLGGTNVNKDIVKSIKDKTLHKKFPLFHNGITILADKITRTAEKISIDTFFVVNGCQSLTALFNNTSELTDDLKILTKFVQVSVDSDLSKIITHFSNNQNGVKARDFKANNNIQVRIQNEFRENYGGEYFYEVKRGEDSAGLEIISNESAGINIMAFDLKQPWATHRKYHVFDEKYTEIFGRPEVTAHRILMLHLVDKIIRDKIPSLTNTLVAKYVLTRFAILYVFRQILEQDNVGRQVIMHPEEFMKDAAIRAKFVQAASAIVDDIVIDFNGEVESLGEDFDYRSRLRDEVWIKRISQDIVSSYLKQVKRNRIDSFETEWNNLTATPSTGK